MENKDPRHESKLTDQTECEAPGLVPNCLPPSALARFEEIRRSLEDRTPVFFLDFDGTVTPLVPHPEMVSVSPATEQTLAALGARYPVCVVSGRDLSNLRKHLRAPNVYYAGDHGHSLEGPAGSSVKLNIEAPGGEELVQIASKLKQDLQGIQGVLIELKQTSLSVHYRLVNEQERSVVEQAVQEAALLTNSLSLRRGKMILELRPRHSWNKGSIVRWLLAQLGLDRKTACPVCVGDDLTDEDMFEAIDNWGISIVVAEELDRPTRARYSLSTPDEVLIFLSKFLKDPYA